MNTTPSVLAEAAPRAAWHRFAIALGWRRVALTLVLALAAALAISPIFVTPASIVVARMLVIALVLLLLFTAAGVWRQRWLPVWLVQVISVMLAAPVMTFVVYLPSVGGDVHAVLNHEGRLQGFISIAATTMIWGALLSLGALYRERDAQARSEALRFALERSQLEKQALDARLKLLHAQIEPHFLFNTLASVQQLVEAGSPRAAPVLRSLTAYLRAAMPTLHDDGATLGAEAALVRAYLELMHMRMPDRLQFEIDVPPELAGLRFPTMALLTLVENAVRHGIDPSEEGGRVQVAARRDGGLLRIAVTDTGLGMAEQSAAGTGLPNLRARLLGFYGPGARLELSEAVPRGVHAEIVIPAEAAS